MPLGHICVDCGDITTAPVAGRCPPHAAGHLARERQRRASKPQRRVWNSARWQRTRKQVLARDGHRCTDCGRHRSELGPNERMLADHIRGVVACMADGREYELDECETRCSMCSGRRDGGRRREALAT